MADGSPAGLAAREAATRLVGQVLERGNFLDDAFTRESKAQPLKGLDHRDRTLVRLIATTTLRRLGQIDNALARFMKKPLPRASGPARDILRTAAAQLLFLETPPHAAIGLAVHAAGADRKARPFKALVNAVLRRVSENVKTLVAEQDAARLDTPDWLWRRWTDAWGEETARSMAEAHLVEPALDITPKGDAKALADRLGARLLPTGSLRLEQAGRITELPGYEEGEWWVQDAAAALPARLLGDVRAARVLDLCAAPGGKTAQLAAADARVTAVDRSAARLSLLTENMKRLRLDAELIEADATAYVPAAPPDMILLDAPCSATGTLRRHPEIAHIRDEAAIGELAQQQRALLDHAIALLAPGGMLVYCTCSLEPEEGEAQIARLLEDGTAVARKPIEPHDVEGIATHITGDGDLRTLPHMSPGGDLQAHGMDGFFAARLVKA